MYATYQANGPMRHVPRATNFNLEDNFEESPIDRSNKLSGRVLPYFVAGTFGLLSPMYMQANAATSNWNINQIEIHQSRQVAGISACTAVDDIALIREAMKISVSELARICGVSRQAVHEWIKGSTLSQKNAQRLSELASVAGIFIESGIEVSPQMLRRNISGGQSILGSIDAGKAVDLARQLVGTLSREAQQRQRLTARLSGRQKPQLDSSEFGAPHFNENA
jgi:DNA-binding transcriptional regulator YiaG